MLLHDDLQNSCWRYRFVCSACSQIWGLHWEGGGALGGLLDFLSLSLVGGTFMPTGTVDGAFKRLFSRKQAETRLRGKLMGFLLLPNFSTSDSSVFCAHKSIIPQAGICSGSHTQGVVRAVFSVETLGSNQLLSSFRW